MGIRGDQLLPQFLMEQFDTSPSQYRHTGHVHEEILFWKNKFLTKLQLCELCLNLDNCLRYFSTFILRCADTGRSTPTTAFDVVIIYFTFTIKETLDIRMKKFYCEKIIFDEMAAL